MGSHLVHTNTSPDIPETAGADVLPRNAVRLAATAGAAGWLVTTDCSPGSATVELTARFMAGRGQAEATLVCRWEAGSSGLLRWDRAVLSVGGKQMGHPYGWPSVAPLLAKLAPSMIDPELEKSGATRHGRTPERWNRDTVTAFKASVSAYWHAAEVLGRLRDEQSGSAAAPGWVTNALAATAGLNTRLIRRRDRVESVLALMEREEAAAGQAGRTPDAGRAFTLSERARTLAEACTKDADAIENAALAAEAEALCAPYVAARAAEADAQEQAWRTAHPGGSAQDFACVVLRAFEVPARDFGVWWQEFARPGMTFTQGWDAWHPGRSTHAESLAGDAWDKDTYLAVFALGTVAAAQLRTELRVGQEQRAEVLEEAAARGAALYAPGASRRIGEGFRTAVTVWSLLADGRLEAWLSSDVRENLKALEPWTRGRTAEAAQRLRTLLLIDHGLRVRQAAHAVVREQLEAADSRRGQAAREAYAAALADGADEAAARQVQRDVLARLEADAVGRGPDGRERFARGDDVWVEPDEEGPSAGRYAARVLCYQGRGFFLVEGFAGGAERGVSADRLGSADAQEAQADRVRQAGVAARLREEQEARAAEARAEEERARVERRSRQERLTARDQAAAGTLPPLPRGEQWRPAHRVPASIGELWAAAARGGWRMTCHTRGEHDRSVLLATICGTTSRGTWAFHLVWNVVRGRYSVNKANSMATWADRRSGPRGGRVRPTIADVLTVMRAETREGEAAAPGELVGGPGRAAAEAHQR
jgi:hypothetical protein